MKTIIALSGGMDSTALLALAKEDPLRRILCVGFRYGSKHNPYENAAARAVAAYYGVPFRLWDLSQIFYGVMKSDLMQDGGAIPEGHYEAESMKRTVVPGRNMIFASCLAGLAWSDQAQQVWLGIHAGDHCLPALTPVSTARGLVPICDIEPGEDKVMSFDPTSNELCWRLVTDKIEKGIPSHTLKITTKSGAVIKCTEEHKIPIAERKWENIKIGYSKSIKLKRAGDLEPGDYLFTAGATIDLPNANEDKWPSEVDLLSLMEIPVVTPGTNPMKYDEDSVWFKGANKVKRFVKMEAVLKLIAWYVTEGFPVGGGPRPNKYGVYISQSEEVHPDNLQDIADTAAEWGFHPSVHGKGKNTTVYFSGPTAKILRRCGERSREQKLPDWILSLPNRLLQIVFDIMISADGHFIKDGALSYATTSKYLISQMAYIGNRLGYKVSVHKQTSGEDSYSVGFYTALEKPNLNRMGECAISPIVKIEKIKNISPVYDITVDGTHNFFAGSTSPILVSNSIYPDCRPDFYLAMSAAVEQGTDKQVSLVAPFLMKTKADIIKETKRLNVPWQLSRTCYKAQSTACGRCGSCIERREAFMLNGMEDPIEYEYKGPLPEKPKKEEVP